MPGFLVVFGAIEEAEKEIRVELTRRLLPPYIVLYDEREQEGRVQLP